MQQPRLCRFLERALSQRDPEERVFSQGALALQRAFEALLQHLGIPYGDSQGLTLASLRGGGATWLYETTRSLELVRWRGRWAAIKTLEVYLQEVAANALLAACPPQVRQRVRRRAAPACR